MSKNCPWWIHFTPILHFKLCFCSEIRKFADSALKPSAHGGAKLDFPRLGNRLWRRGVCLVLHILILGFGAALPPQQSLHSHLDPHVWSQTAWAFKVSILWEKNPDIFLTLSAFLGKDLPVTLFKCNEKWVCAGFLGGQRAQLLLLPLLIIVLVVLGFFFPLVCIWNWLEKWELCVKSLLWHNKPVLGKKCGNQVIFKVPCTPKFHNNCLLWGWTSISGLLEAGFSPVLINVEFEMLNLL